MKKVAVMGLIDWINYGEQFLGNTVSYLVGTDYDIKSIDFRPKKNKCRYLVYYFTVILAKILAFWKKSHCVVLFGIKCLAKRYYEEQLKDCDSIIFACGSYKYGTQKLWAYYSVVIEVAQKLNIPVMFNAMNIQDFKEDDWRCKCLKKYTNYQCVKVFTTRDGEYGLNKLRTDYLEKDTPIYSDAVGDPAFWIPECYGVKRMNEGNKVGVNLIRGGVFEDYGLHITEQQLLEIYCQLIRKLETEQIDWEMFTNGLEVDLDFGKAVLQRCGMSERKIVVPKSAQDLVERIAGYKGVIGARLHACICAYSLDVPVVGFIWDEKMLRFAQISDLEENFLKEEELSGEALYETLRDLLDKSYNKELRDIWKQKTKVSIEQFLTQYMG